MTPIIYQVDAFTNVPFKGNPAGVMIVDDKTSTEFMQNMALEMNLSESAFLIPDGTNFIIRYFTPAREVPLCGHATLASAHIIYEKGLKESHESFTFKAKGGELKIRRKSDSIIMEFPRYPLKKIEPQHDFKKIVGFHPVEMYESAYDWIVLIAGSEKEIQDAKPDFGLMMANHVGHMIVTAKSEKAGTDFVLRCFVPSVGINEDPVTGSAHCALTPLWTEKLNKAELHSTQLSYRTGKLITRLTGERVEIMGQAVTVFQGAVAI